MVPFSSSVSDGRERAFFVVLEHIVVLDLGGRWGNDFNADGGSLGEEWQWLLSAVRQVTG